MGDTPSFFSYRYNTRHWRWSLSLFSYHASLDTSAQDTFSLTLWLRYLTMVSMENDEFFSRFTANGTIHYTHIDTWRESPDAKWSVKESVTLS